MNMSSHLPRWVTLIAIPPLLCWLNVVVWWCHPAETTMIAIWSVKARLCHLFTAASLSLASLAAVLKKGNPPHLWDRCEGKVTVTINTPLSVCLVTLHCVRLISWLPGLEETSGPDNQRGMERKTLDWQGYMGHIQCLYFKGITVSTCDPPDTVIVIIILVMVSLQLSSYYHKLTSQGSSFFWSPASFLRSQFYLRFYCLPGYIKRNMCLKWFHINCVRLGRALKHTQTQAHKLTKGGISGQIRSSPVTV